MTPNPRNNSNVGLQRFYRHLCYTKLLDCHLNFRKCTLTVEYIPVLRVAALIFGVVKTKWRAGKWSPQNSMASSWFLCTDGFNSEILPRGFVMQCQILINVNIFVAYELNLPHTKSLLLLAMRWKFWLMTDARYISLPLISRYHCLDTTNRDISRVHCNTQSASHN